jgi:hypothetical protein
VKGDFEFKLGALHIHMMEEIKVIFTPFLEFASIYNVIKAHNMFAFMLNLWFKSLDVLKTYAGKAKVIHMVAKYDNTSLMPFWWLPFNF